MPTKREQARLLRDVAVNFELDSGSEYRTPKGIRKGFDGDKYVVEGTTLEPFAKVLFHSHRVGTMSIRVLRKKLPAVSSEDFRVLLSDHLDRKIGGYVMAARIRVLADRIDEAASREAPQEGASLPA